MAQNRAYNELAETWAQKDAAAASVWIKSLPAGEARDSAAIPLIRQIRSEDPAGSLEWARTLGSAETRKEETKEIFESWLQHEPLKAAAALQTLPVEEQQKLFGERGDGSGGGE
jgi:3-deoxy-D-manno-octulosonic-acid transferase